MNKTIIAAAVWLSIFAGLFSGVSYAAQEEIKVVASFYPVYITAKNVLRDVPGVSLSNLLPPLTGCLHDYALTTNDMRRIVDAQVFVANGAGMESFLEKSVAQNPHLKVIELSANIPLIKGGGESGNNPHIWVSISNAITQVNNLAKAMERIDPGHKEIYARNAAIYAGKLEALGAKMHAELAPYKGRQIITFHEAFAYFAGDFSFKVAGVVEREPGSAPSAQELTQTIEVVKSRPGTVLFSEPQYPPAAAMTIARETGIKVYTLDPAVSGPDDYDAYLNIMERNLIILKQAFRKE